MSANGRAAGRRGELLVELDAGRIVTYCGARIAASSAGFALALFGRGDVVVCDASPPEWAADPSLPMERG